MVSLNFCFRFQEQYDIQNELEKDNNEAEDIETMHISSIDAAIDEVSDSLKSTSNEPKTAKRKNHVGCDECDIPFNTKKELKVNLPINSSN